MHGDQSRPGANAKSRWKLYRRQCLCYCPVRLLRPQGTAPEPRLCVLWFQTWAGLHNLPQAKLIRQGGSSLEYYLTALEVQSGSLLQLEFGGSRRRYGDTQLTTPTHRHCSDLNSIGLSPPQAQENHWPIKPKSSPPGARTAAICRELFILSATWVEKHSTSSC